MSIIQMISSYRCLYIQSNGKIKRIIKKRSIVWVFWDDDDISELCEKWMYLNGNYGNTRFEELRKRSDEVLFTREYKATASKYNSDTYIDIDMLQMFKIFLLKIRLQLELKIC